MKVAELLQLLDAYETKVCDGEYAILKIFSDGSGEIIDSKKYSAVIEFEDLDELINSLKNFRDDRIS